MNEIATYLSSFERKSLEELEDEVKQIRDQIGTDFVAEPIIFSIEKVLAIRKWKEKKKGLGNINCKVKFLKNILKILK